MQTENLLVSAIIPTRNRSKLLLRALQSVVSQTYSLLEVIVVDDGSTDNTESVVNNFQQNHLLQYIKNEVPQGASKARNIGIEAANGKFIAGLDDDDEWHKDRISEMIAAYSNEYSCITSDTTMVFPKGEAVWKKKEVIDLNTLLFTNQVGNQVLVKRERLLAVGGFDTNLKAAQDYDLWIRLCEKYGSVKNVQKPLQTIYINHDAERISDHSSFEGYLQFYKKHKLRMNRKQRKYQLYKIRRAQGKKVPIKDFFSRVPFFRWRKEMNHILIDKFWQ